MLNLYIMVSKMYLIYPVWSNYVLENHESEEICIINS